MRKKTIFMSMLMVFSIGCTDSSSIDEAKLKSAIAEYLSKDLLCIRIPHVFPANISASYYALRDDVALGSLVDVGILQASKLNDSKKTRYELTREGESLAITDVSEWSGNEGTRFCPVQVKVVEIVNYTLPGENAANQTTLVDFRYKISEVAPWGTAEIVGHNMLLEETIQKKGQLIQRKESLVNTKAGWKVIRPRF